MVDAFRLKHPHRRNAFTCWNTKIGARQTNFGTRIDYILMSSNLVPLLSNCDIMPEYEGSDHCPVYAELKCDSVSENRTCLPSICTRLWPEFHGKQQTIKNFLKKTQDLADNLTKLAESSSSSLRKNLQKDKNKQKSIMSFLKSPHATKNSSNAVIKSNESNTESDETSNGCNSVNCVDDGDISSQKSSTLASEWKSMFKGPPKPPLCSGHSKPCALRTVKKKGPNCGRQFFICAQPVGLPSNPDASCNYFQWVSAAKVNTLK